MWCGFLSAWLLVLGPVYQAILEIHAEEDASERMRTLTNKVPPPPKVSNWWWLLPPAHMIQRHRQRNRQRELMIGIMTAEDHEVLGRFSNLAAGWMFVGLGGYLLAVKETWDLIEHFDGGVALFAAVFVAMTAGCFAAIIGRQRRTARRLGRELSSYRRGGAPGAD